MRILISINCSIFHKCFRPENRNIESTKEECINLKQYSPSIENEANKESFKGSKNVEHTQIEDHHENLDSSIIQLEVPQKDKPKRNRRKNLHLRPDVVNKTLLRAVKRFYFNKFKNLQRFMAKKGFKNVRTAHILDTLADF